MHCTEIQFSGHALRQMFARRISVQDALDVIEKGETVSDYPDDTPYPSRLILGWIHDRPLHVVVGRNPDIGQCTVITAYEPEKEIWTNDFRRRKSE